MRKCAVLTALALAIAIGLAAHSYAQGGKKLKLAFITNNSSDFWTICKAGCLKAVAENPGIDLQFEICGEGNAAGQRRIIDDLLTSGLDGIAISPVDAKNQITLLNNAAKQALLITSDSDAADSNRVCYIGTDNVAAGQMAGGEIKKALPGGGKIMLFVGDMSAANAQERLKGIKDTLAGGNIQIIDVRTDNADKARAKANAVDTITGCPDVAALVGLWSYNGPAIADAVKTAKKVGQIKIVCFDEDEGTLNGIKDGVVSATIVQQPFEFGYQSMTFMYRYLLGDKSMVPADKKIIVPTRVITKDNLDQFWMNLRKQRGH